VNCAICGIRKARRYCLAVRADICTVCCGTEREQTLNCPLGCEYLRDAHRHERLPQVDPKSVPDHGVEVTEQFLVENEMLMVMLAGTLFDAAIASSEATDYDVREALESLITTYRSMDSGIYYESLPSNPFAAEICRQVIEQVTAIRRGDSGEPAGAAHLREATIMRMLVFLQRLEYANNNGRKRSRAFLDLLRGMRENMAPRQETIREPDGPRIIL